MTYRSHMILRWAAAAALSLLGLVMLVGLWGPNGIEPAHALVFFGLLFCAATLAPLEQIGDHPRGGP